MSLTHTITGLATLGVVAQLAIMTILPEPKPIEVHSLTYDSGVVTQDRTVRTYAPFFYASWSAKVTTLSGDPVGGCEGGGSWNYEPGRIAFDMPLGEWVGSDQCQLQPGEYRLVASWFWGADQETHKSDIFEVTE